MKKKYYDASSKKSCFEQIQDGLKTEIKATQDQSYNIHMSIK